MSSVLHASGTFCWRELATPDLVKAGAFYGELMGWELQEASREGSVARAQCCGRQVATLRPPRADLGENVGAARWLSYISVESMEESIERVTLLGGEVLIPSIQMPGCREAALIADPSGARVALCRSSPDREPRLVEGAPGSCCWTELATRDAQRAAVFYAQLLGWKARVIMHDSSPATLFLVKDTPVAGLLQLNGEPPIPPSNWMVCFEVESADDTVEQARRLGGGVSTESTDIPGVGRSADLTDPQGAPFSILESMDED